MSKQPKISVIIPVYNVEKYLRQCLDSVVNQTLQDIEIICINDGSTDSSKQILIEYAARYSQINLIDKENSGYGASVNIGLEMATGRYIGIVEPDDFVELSMYEKLYSCACSEEDVDIVRSPYWEFYEYPQVNPYKKLVNFRYPPFQVFTVFQHPEILSRHPSIWSAIYRRDFLVKNRIRMVEASGAGWVDNPFFLESMYLAKKILWLPEPFYNYRQTNPNASSNLKDCTIPFRRLMEMYDFVEKKKISDPDILKYIYRRNIHYIKLVESNPNFAESIVHPYIEITLEKIDKGIMLSKLSSAEIDLYNKYSRINIDNAQLKSTKYKHKATWLPRKLRGAYLCMKENGFRYTLMRLMIKIGLKEEKKNNKTL